MHPNDSGFGRRMLGRFCINCKLTQEQQAAALPKSALGAAIRYALRNWRRTA
jgi:hypothetical protein